MKVFDTNGRQLFVGETGAAGMAGYGVTGLTGSPNAGTPLTKYDLSVHQVRYRRPSDNDVVVRTGIGPLTVDITVAGPAANGRDQAGAFSASSDVHVYLIWNGTTDALLASATAPPTGPALPTGYTHWAYATTLKLNGSTNFRVTRQRGLWVWYGKAFDESAILLNGAAVTETAVDTSSMVPAIALDVEFFLDFRVSTGVTGTGFPYVLYGVITGSAFHALVGVKNTSTDEYINDNAALFPNIGQNIFYTITEVHADDTTTTTVRVMGYTDPNGDS